jgi:hypothetical protein
MPEAIFRTFIFLFFLALGGLGVVRLRRTLRGEKVFSDRDWLFLFGRPKNEVLTATFWIKVSCVVVICFLIGLVEYVIVAPYGLGWYLVLTGLTVFAIALFAFRYLQGV